MSDEEEDEILKRLNEKLEADEKEKKIQDEVDKRYNEPREEEEEEKKGPRAAQFKDKKGKKREVERRKPAVKYKCHYCGSEDSVRLDDGKTIYKYRNKDFDGLLKQVRKCTSCGARYGVA